MKSGKGSMLLFLAVLGFVIYMLIGVARKPERSHTPQREKPRKSAMNQIPDQESKPSGVPKLDAVIEGDLRPGEMVTIPVLSAAKGQGRTLDLEAESLSNKADWAEKVAPCTYDEFLLSRAASEEEKRKAEAFMQKGARKRNLACSQYLLNYSFGKMKSPDDLRTLLIRHFIDENAFEKFMETVARELSQGSSDMVAADVVEAGDDSMTILVKGKSSRPELAIPSQPISYLMRWQTDDRVTYQLASFDQVDATH